MSLAPRRYTGIEMVDYIREALARYEPRRIERDGLPRAAVLIPIYVSDDVPHVLLQPSNKGTAPGILWPAHWVSRRDPEAVVAVFPADHFIHPEPAFLAYVAQAVEIAQHHPDLVVLLGVRPDRAEEGYGWIEPGEPLPGVAGCARVGGFWEKPPPERAASFRWRASPGGPTWRF